MLKNWAACYGSKRPLSIPGLLNTAADWNEDITIIVFVLALVVAVSSVGRTQDRRGWAAHDHAQD